MAPRAIWKGHLKLAEFLCPVALYTAASTAERLTFHVINRRTGHRVRLDHVDSETGDPVPREDQVKGYDLGGEDCVILTPGEVAAAVPHSDKTLTVQDFIPCDQVDTVFLERPYYMTPADPLGAEGYILLARAMADRKVAALARAVLFRRIRTVLIRPHGPGLVASTLNYDHEVRPAAEVFRDVAAPRIAGEMLDLAEHIIDRKAGDFDPAGFEDRYEAALEDLVKAKIEGRAIRPARPPRETRSQDLLPALRDSAGDAAPGRKARAKADPAPPRAKGKKAG